VRFFCIFGEFVYFCHEKRAGKRRKFGKNAVFVSCLFLKAQCKGRFSLTFRKKAAKILFSA